MSDEHDKYLNGLAAIAGIAVVSAPEAEEPGGEFPKMLYHPEGEAHPSSHHEMIVAIVNDPSEEATLLAEGWHLHPSEAIAARDGKPPVVPPIPPDPPVVH